MLTIKDFKKPSRHPFGMCRGMNQASEKESFMCWFLRQCIKAGNINAEVKTRNDEDYMSGEHLGMLEKVSTKTYKLTIKAKGLLYAHFGKP